MQTVAHLKAVKISFRLMYNSPMNNKHALNESNVKGGARLLAGNVFPSFASVLCVIPVSVTVRIM